MSASSLTLLRPYCSLGNAVLTLQLALLLPKVIKAFKSMSSEENFKLAQQRLIDGLCHMSSILLIKTITHDQRPCHGTHDSFPSGHTSTSSIFAYLSADLINKQPSLFFPTLTALARVIEKAHHPKDVIAALLLSSLNRYCSQNNYSRSTTLTMTTLCGLLLFPPARFFEVFVSDQFNTCKKISPY